MNLKQDCLAMLIREASSQDIDQLVAIEELCYDSPWLREAFEEEIERGDVGIGLVAEEEGLVVGFLTGMAAIDEFNLHNIAVHPDFRRQGIGRSLIEAMESICKRKGYRHIVLEVRGDNEVARSFYQVMGFTSSGVRKDYYGPGMDANMYEKNIGSE